MSDPRFETREALQRWEQGAVATVCAMAKLDDLRVGDMLKVADSIERVRAAHAHLLGDRPALTQTKDTTDDALSSIGGE